MTPPTGHFIWYELMTTDPDAAAKFYGEVVGWSARDFGAPGMDYRLLSSNGIDVGGLLAISTDGAANGMRPIWVGYISVADVDATVAEAMAAGGKTYMPPTDFPGVGRIAMVTDPQGAAFYAMKPVDMGDLRSQSFDPYKHGHGGWHELHTSDWEAALAFYGAHFGWRKVDTLDMGPMGKYITFNTGAGDHIGGMMTDRNFPKPMWLYYFFVDDIDAAHGRVKAAGGTMLHGPVEVPGGGWIINAKDPQGAMFALVGPK